MKRRLMAFTAIAALALPLAAAPLEAFAQDQQAQPRRESPARGMNRPERPQMGREDTPRPPRIERPSRPETSAPRPERPPSIQRPDRPTPDAQRPSRPEGGWNRPDRPNTGGQRPDRPEGGWNRPDRPNTGGQRPDRPGSGWNRPDRPGSGWNNGRDRDRQREDFRRRFNGDQWRRDFYRNHRSDWWRNDSRFRGYSGVRIGFYFAPGWGYYSVPRSYWGRSWSVGQYLPDVFWRYQLNDWRTYGLGYPPEGTRWVSVDNTLYLIDDYDGYIIDVIRDAWRW